MWVVAIPITVAMFEHEPVNAITWIGVGLAAVGLFFETVGDAQLARFKSDPANDGQDNGPRAVVMDAAPELLRRHLRDVRLLADCLRCLGRCRDRSSRRS